MDVLLLSRIQFAFTVAFHILWPAFTIGIASYVALLSFLTWRTNDPIYRALMRFWIRIFALGFGMGVITGIVLGYQIGTNWSGFSRSVSNVLGPFFMYEVLSAFFLEAGFIGIVLFGERRVGPGMHFFACLMVACGTLISAGWILASNSWMQTPAGYTVDAAGVFHVSDWLAAFFNPSYPYRLMHMLCASYLSGSFVVAGVSAYHLWRGTHVTASRTAFSMAMWACLILAPLQVVIGDAHGRNTLEHQPVKVAAMEGLWETERAVPSILFAWPDMKQERNLYTVSIPIKGFASLYLTHSWDGEVQGLKAVPAADRPYVPLVFFAFRIMVGIALILLGLAFVGAYLRWRGQLFTARWFQIACMAATPLGFIAIVAGWTVTETGRQPFVVHGHLRTADAVTVQPAGAVLTSLILFFVLYNLLMIAFFWYGARVAMRGPDAQPDENPNAVRPGLEQASPAIVGGSPAHAHTLAPGE